MKPLYEEDIAAWALDQSDALRTGTWEDLDITHLLKELEALRDRYLSELENRLRTLLEHLLKLAYAPPHIRHDNQRVWRLTCTESRRRLWRRLLRTPSLEPDLRGMLEGAYDDARLEVLQRLEDLDDDALPETCPWTLDEVRRDGFFPI